MPSVPTAQLLGSIPTEGSGSNSTLSPTAYNDNPPKGTEAGRELGTPPNPVDSTDRPLAKGDLGERYDLFLAKYKPHSIDDFFASYKFKSVLRTLLDIDDLNILFIGNACSGKTILLHTMVHEYYQLLPGQPIPEHNVMYIHNLKEQGVEYFRNDLKTFSQSHSTVYGKKKMVIIDDIDTIHEQNQQVIRNYMDKYRHNVHFVAVCSNIQKVIESFQSRVHIIRIEPSNHDQMEELYEKIVHAEQFVLEPAAKRVLLQHCRHSIRALINHMEKLWILRKDGGSDDVITEDMCRRICSDISFQRIETYLTQLRNHDVAGAIQTLYHCHDYGFSVIDILENLFQYVKSTPHLTEEEKYRSVPLFCKYITLFYGVHEDVIELALFTHDFFQALNQSADP
jgi:DNA polymerase III delta prime subunit